MLHRDSATLHARRCVFKITLEKSIRIFRLIIKVALTSWYFVTFVYLYAASRWCCVTEGLHAGGESLLCLFVCGHVCSWNLSALWWLVHGTVQQLFGVHAGSPAASCSQAAKDWSFRFFFTLLLLSSRVLFYLHVICSLVFIILLKESCLLCSTKYDAIGIPGISDDEPAPPADFEFTRWRWSIQRWFLLTVSLKQSTSDLHHKLARGTTVLSTVKNWIILV